MNRSWTICLLISMTGCSDYKPSGIVSATRVHEAFDSGAKLGYECHVRGGSREDLTNIVGMFRAGNIDAAKEWFDKHP